MNTRRLFDTWLLVVKGNLGFCGLVCRKEKSNVRLVVIRANTTEKGDTVLGAQFLNQTPSVHKSSHGCAGKQTFGKPQFFNHSCSHKISASGRSVGSFRRHCLRKSSRRGDNASGMGGSVSSTIRNMTVFTRYQ
jgi:hypothetical protein